MRRVVFDGNGTASRAIRVAGGNLEMRNSALRNFRGVDRGGAILVEGGHVVISNDTVIEANEALQEGGAMAIYGGVVELSSRTALRGNVAPVGTSIFMANYLWRPSPTLTYTLPTPIAHWVNAFESRATLQPGAIDGNFPFPCSPGLFASVSSVRAQSSPACESACPPGKYCEGATVVPELCPLGTYCPQGSAAPRQCDTGYRGSVTGLTRASGGVALGGCDQCDAGHECKTGVSYQTRCLAGTFASQPGSGECEDCATGRYQPEIGATSCIDCPKGSYCGALSQTPCPVGTYNELTRQNNPDACRACPSLARFDVQLHSSPEGSISHTNCSCDSEKYLFQLDPLVPEWEEAACGCRRGLAYNKVDEECEECPPGTSARAGPIEVCDVCREGFFKTELSMAASPSNCEPCLVGLHCPWNTSLETATLVEGFWRLTPRVRDVGECLGGSSSRSNLTVCRPGGVSGACAPGYTGPMCKKCDAEDTYYDEGVCEACPSTSNRLAIFLTVGGICLLLACLLFWVYKLPIKRVPKRYHKPLHKFRRLVRTSAWCLSSTGLMPKIKIVVSFYQVGLTLDNVYGLELPDSYTRWTAGFQFLKEVDLTGIALPSDCLISSFRESLILNCVAPLIIFGAVCVSMVAFKCAKVVCSADREAAYGPLLRHAAVEAVQDFLPFLLTMTFFFVPSVSAKIFSTMSCVGYEEDYKTDDGERLQRWYLRRDLRVICYGDDGTHDELVSLMWIFAIIWPIGMVVVYVVLLVPCKEAILLGKKTPLTRATAFLTHDYEPHVFFWEPLELFRRTALTGWVLLFDERSWGAGAAFLRLLGGMFISLSFLVALLSVKPYDRPEDDLLATAAQLMLTIIFFGGVLLKVFTDLSLDPKQKATVVATMVFESQEQIVLFIIVVTIAMLVILILIVLAEAAKAYTMALAEAKWSIATVGAPTFDWDPTGSFCCFLSHYKMEAASDARYLHDQLRKMLQCPVYLDSSTLNDLRTLFTEGGAQERLHRAARDQGSAHAALVPARDSRGEQPRRAHPAHRRLRPDA